LKELETTLREEVARLFEMGEQADQGDVELPEGLVIQDEILFVESVWKTLRLPKSFWMLVPKSVMNLRKPNMM